MEQYITTTQKSQYNLSPVNFHQDWKSAFKSDVVKQLKGKTHPFGYVRRVEFVSIGMPYYGGSHLDGDMTVPVTLKLSLIHPRVGQCVTAYVEDVNPVFIQASAEGMMVTLPPSEDDNIVVGDRIIVKIPDGGVSYDAGQYIVSGDIVDLSKINTSFVVPPPSKISIFDEESSTNVSDKELQVSEDIDKMVSLRQEKLDDFRASSIHAQQVGRFYTHQYSMVSGLNGLFQSVASADDKADSSWFEFWEVLNQLDIVLPDKLNSLHFSNTLKGGIQALTSFRYANNSTSDTHDDLSSIDKSSIGTIQYNLITIDINLNAPNESITSIGVALALQQINGIMILRFNNYHTRLFHDIVKLLSWVYDTVVLYRPHIMDITDQNLYVICGEYNSNDADISNLSIIAQSTSNVKRFLSGVDITLGYSTYIRNLIEQQNTWITEANELITKQVSLKTSSARISRKKALLSNATSWMSTYQLPADGLELNDQPNLIDPPYKPTRKPERKPARKPERKPGRKPTSKPTRKPTRKPVRKSAGLSAT